MILFRLYLALLLCVCANLYGNDIANNDNETNISSYEIYAKYNNFPQKIYENERFAVEVKVLIFGDNVFNDFNTSYEGGRGFEVVDDTQRWQSSDNHTFVKQFILKAKTHFQMPTLHIISTYSDFNITENINYTSIFTINDTNTIFESVNPYNISILMPMSIKSLNKTLLSDNIANSSDLYCHNISIYSLLPSFERAKDLININKQCIRIIKNNSSNTTNTTKNISHNELLLKGGMLSQIDGLNISAPIVQDLYDYFSKNKAEVLIIDLNMTHHNASNALDIFNDTTQINMTTFADFINSTNGANLTGNTNISYANTSNESIWVISYFFATNSTSIIEQILSNTTTNETNASNNQSNDSEYDNATSVIDTAEYEENVTATNQTNITTPYQLENASSATNQTNTTNSSSTTYINITPLKTNLLPPKKIEFIKIASKEQDFSHIIASKIEVEQVQVTQYNNKNYKIILLLQGYNSNLEDLHLKAFGIFQKQILLQTNHTEQYLAYELLAPITTNNIKITYYSLVSDRFESINIPIRLSDTFLSVQQDINPRFPINAIYEKALLLCVAFLCLVLFYLTRHIIFVFIGTIIMLYLLLVVARLFLNEVELKAGTHIFLLPTSNSFVYEELDNVTKANVILHKDKWSKILIDGRMIGWIQNENIKNNN